MVWDEVLPRLMILARLQGTVGPELGWRQVPHLPGLEILRSYCFACHTKAILELYKGLNRALQKPRKNGATQPRRATMSLKRVTMKLTENDIRNTESLQRRLHTRNKASAVSGALAIAEALTRRIEDGGELIIRQRNGVSETMIIPGMRQRPF